jgi:two-component system, NarL family, sensor kinase
MEGTQGAAKVAPDPAVALPEQAASLPITPAVSSPRPAQPTVSVRRLVVRFVLAGIPALTAAIVITAIASERIGTRIGVQDAKRVSFVAAALVAEQGLEDGLLNGQPAARDAMDDVVRRYIVRGSLVIVKLHAADGRIVYSSEGGITGQRFPLDAKSQSVLDGAVEVVSDFADVRTKEDSVDGSQRLLEVFRRVETPNGTPLVFEAYFRYSAVLANGRDLWRQFAPIAVGALLVLELVQIPIAISLARRLRAGQQQRERLLQHAIESSDFERRRIASDLHDGAVQDLTGVSISLSAAARTAHDDTSRDAMHDAGSKIRETVKSLRSMLVDIYPPNLHEEGLQSALADLLGSLHNREIRTTLQVDDGTGQLPRESISLLYRGAQEALRNVANHAQATEVAVAVTMAPRQVVLVVEDNGRGFDVDELANRARRGHVGLRSLVGLVQDAGGDIEIRSLLKVGTRMQIVLPR